ncbi:MAG: hypothetical protein ACYCVD_17270 [Desulfitobacteriaceae bacterium]
MLGLPIQSLVNGPWPHDLPPSFIRLFEEYLRRKRELRSARQREAIWLVTLVLAGVLALISPWLGSNIAINIVTLALVYVVYRHYLKVRAQVSHVFVNFNVLHHHLLGKLEIGFCGHQERCNCTNEFRRFAWKKYRISLYGETF